MIILPNNLIRRLALFAVAVSLIAEVTMSPTNLAHRSALVHAGQAQVSAPQPLLFSGKVHICSID